MSKLTIDNFSRETFEACPQKFYWRMRLHLVPKIKKSMAPEYGIAIHEGLASYYKEEGEEEAIKKFAISYQEVYDGEDKERTLENGAFILCQYFADYSDDYLETLKVGGSPMVEIGASMELKNCIYTGRIDWIALNNVMGKVTVLDHKTAKHPNSGFLIVKPNNALTGYAMLVSEILNLPIEELTMMLNVVGTYIKKKEGKVDMVRMPTSRTAQDVERFKGEVVKVVGQIEECDKTGLWERRTKSCSSYNGCEYKELCNASEEALPHLIPTLYEERKWEAFGEED